MGAHFYREVNGEWRLSKTVDTIAKARNSPYDYCASVTTKLGIAPNPFITQWREKRLVSLARAFPLEDYEKLSERAWGVRECPETGEDISSSDFGTNLHAALEDWSNEFKVHGHGPGCYPEGPYEGWVKLWCEWVLKNSVDVVECEKLIGCKRRALAGTIDFIGRAEDGKYFLADFKSRAIGDKDIKTCHYPKDGQQLAIEAKMIQEQWGLGYMPDIYTVIFDTDTPRMYVKQWTDKAKLKHLDDAERLNCAYNLIMKLGGNETPENINNT